MPIQRARRKAIEVDAVQWFKDGDHPQVKIRPGLGPFIKGAWPEGGDVSPGDWIVNDYGRYRVLTPQQFAAEYDLL